MKAEYDLESIDGYNVKFDWKIVKKLPGLRDGWV